jgi:hypothetical protein
MGWKETVRAIQTAQKRAEAEALQRSPGLNRYEKARAKEAQRFWAQSEAQQFDGYLDGIVSMHKACGSKVNWEELASAPQPSEPAATRNRESSARERLTLYKPGFFDKLFRNDKKRIATLEAAVQQAIAEDAAEIEAKQKQYQLDVGLWSLRRKIANGVLARTPTAYREALDNSDRFDDLVERGIRVTILAIEQDGIAFGCEAIDDDAVPTEEVKLSAAGKVSVKDMPPARHWTLLQDYLASAALRIGREAFSVLPVSRVVVNAGRVQVNTVTGHDELVTLIAVHFAKGTMEPLNFAALDPSDSLKNFPHRMKFKKSAGFEVVEPMTLEEQWVTAG